MVATGTFSWHHNVQIFQVGEAKAKELLTSTQVEQV
jgi:hypothetical protein